MPSSQVSFTDEQSNIQWHCNSADVPSRQLLSKDGDTCFMQEFMRLAPVLGQDIIDDEKRDSDAQEMARRFLEEPQLNLKGHPPEGHL